MSPVLKAMQVSNNRYRSIVKSMDAEGYPPKQNNVLFIVLCVGVVYPQ